MSFSYFEIVPEVPLIHIIDVGAMLLGTEPLVYRSLVERGVATVIGFEPVPAECDRLNKELGPTQRFLPYFVGDGTQGTFHLTNASMTSSLYSPNTPLLEQFQNLAELVRVVQTEPVQTTRLDDLGDLISDCDFFKLDIQGAELATFRGGSRVLQQATVIQTEVNFVPLYEKQPLFAEVDIHLRGAGFLFHRFWGISGRSFKPFLINNNINQALSQQLWADAVYVKDFLQLERLGAEKLLKMGCLLHEIFGSYDLAFRTLVAHDNVTGGDFSRKYLQRFVG